MSRSRSLAGPSGAHFSLIAGIGLPALSILGLFPYLGPSGPTSPLPAVLILLCVTGSALATVLGLAAALRFREVRAVGLFGVTLNLLYLLGFATFQIALLLSSRS